MKYENKSDKSSAHVRRWREVNLAMAKNKKKLKLFYFQQFWVNFDSFRASLASFRWRRLKRIRFWILFEKFAILFSLLVCLELGRDSISNINIQWISLELNQKLFHCQNNYAIRQNKIIKQIYIKVIFHIFWILELTTRMRMYLLNIFNPLRVFVCLQLVCSS